MSGEAHPVDGRATRWSGQHERRRDEFVEAALLAIAEHGPDVSTEQIAQRAGVARTRLYKHFGGAQDLQVSIARRAVELVSAELDPVWNPRGTPTEMIEGAITSHLRWLTEHSNLYRYLSKHSVSGTQGGADAVTDVKGAIAQHLSTFVSGHFAAFELDVGQVEPLTYGLVGFVDSAASRWIDAPGRLTLDDMVDFLSASIWAILDQRLRTQGFVIDPDQPLGATPAPAPEGGIDALLTHARSGLDRVQVQDLETELAAGAWLVDTRPVEQRERDGELPGATVIDRNVLEWRLDPTSSARLPEADDPDRRIILLCNEGYSSSLAAAALREIGLHRATDLVGGYQAVLAHRATER